jgi:cell division protein FtsB
VKRVVLLVVLLGLAGFAVEGGTYGTRDLLRLKSQVQDEQRRIARLRIEVDSYARIDRDLKTNPVAQESVARELYGMIRPGEILYQVVPKDTTH